MAELMKAYFKHLREILERVEETQAEAMSGAARMVADAVTDGLCIFAFGCNHAALCTLELYYRSGGLAVVNPLRGPGLTLDVDPATLTTQMERLPGYGRILLDESAAKSGDVLIIHSVSGRNAVSVDMALHAQEKGIRTICLTNMNTSRAVPSRHESGRRLFEICDLVIDNCGDYGDASIQPEGFAGRVAPTSTSIGTAILNAVMLEACGILMERGIEPPVFLSSNVPGSDEHNAQILKKYRETIHYMGK